LVAAQSKGTHQPNRFLFGKSARILILSRSAVFFQRRLVSVANFTHGAGPVDLVTA